MSDHLASIAPATGGWLVTCPCGYERHATFRHGADRAASDHKANPPKPKRSKSSAPKPQSGATWDNREDSTWIDKL